MKNSILYVISFLISIVLPDVSYAVSDIRGIYSANFTEEVINCVSASDNGTVVYSGELDIFEQTGSNFLASFSDPGAGITSNVWTGIIDELGNVSGTYSYIEDGGATLGEGEFTGIFYLPDSTINTITVIAADTVGDTCTSSGMGEAKRTSCPYLDADFFENSVNVFLDPNPEKWVPKNSSIPGSLCTDVATPGFFDNCIGTKIVAEFEPINGCTITAVARGKGVDHFNWLQRVTNHPFPKDSLGRINLGGGCLVPIPTVDPVLGGGCATESTENPTGISDWLPYYWDDGPIVSPYLLDHISAHTFSIGTPAEVFQVEFYDTPAAVLPTDILPVNAMMFETKLVGVVSGSISIAYNVFTWSSTFNGTTGGGALFNSDATGPSNGYGGVIDINTSVTLADLSDESKIALLDNGVVNIPVPPGAPKYVSMDVLPKDELNSIKIRSKFTLKLTVLNTQLSKGERANFDPATIDVSSIRFGDIDSPIAAPIRSQSRDIDKDGDIDLLLVFNGVESNLSCSTGRVALNAITLSGEIIRAVDGIMPICN